MSVAATIIAKKMPSVSNERYGIMRNIEKNENSGERNVRKRYTIIPKPSATVQSGTNMPTTAMITPKRIPKIGGIPRSLSLLCIRLIQKNSKKT